MKTIVNKLRFALLLGFVAMSVTAWSQAVPYINKMSITTQMFLDEMAGNISFETATPTKKLIEPGERELPTPYRPIALPDTVNGRLYIASFIQVTNESVIGELEALGVEVQCKFKNGTLITTNIPVDAIEQVAAIAGVERINVSSVMKPMTDRTRTATNVDDVLTLSSDASTAGLLKQYDGSGVILGIIDSGIDYQHGAFKDASGNSRIVGAYCYNGSSVTADWTGSGTLPTTDNTSSDHGTHTSSIAGGSSVVVNGSTVTVTNDHANATYGGMAPGAELFLAGTQLYTTYSMNAFQKMVEYADQQGKPLVVSNSWGGTWYPNDGSSDFSQVFSDYFGDAHPNRIALFAAGNEAGTGGFAVSGSASNAEPLGTIVRPLSSTYGYYHVIANAWTRATDATGIGINIYVLSSNGSIYRTYSYTSSDGNQTITLSGLSGTLNLYFDYAGGDYTSKKQALLYAGSSISSSSSYRLAIEVYPIGGSTDVVDVWANGGYVYYDGDNYLTTSGHTWTKGTDDMSANGECMNENVISVGSYVTRSSSSSNSVGDISDFSSYTVEGMGPQGTMHPWITAPGQVIISGLNHYVSSHSSVTVSSSSSPYGQMSGTSMATPAAAGIVALWMQAATEKGKTLSLSEVKNIMKETAIKDSYVTSGSNASHFGNGKIDALAGIEYILNNDTYSDPIIAASSTSVSMTAEPNATATTTIDVAGISLTEGITVTVNDPSNVFTVTLGNTNTLNASGTQNMASTGGKLNVTYSPTAEGTHTGTVTLASAGAETVTITLNGTAAIKTEFTICDGTSTNGAYLPLWGYWYDNKQINQMIYPADSLVDIVGKTIKSITFYPETSIAFYNGSFNVSVGMTDQSTFTSVKRITGLTKVATSQSPTRYATELTITFDPEFEYTGGNLVVDFEKSETTGNYGDTQFKGATLSGNVSFYSRGNSSNSVNSNGVYSSGSGLLTFLPKVTIVAEGGSTTPTVETPVILPADGSEFNTAPQEVTITCGTSGATIYYSIDGGNTYQEYTGAFNVSGNVTVMAYATAADMDDSETASATYTFKAEAPVISPASGSLVEGQQVTITCPTSGATIYYSSDGGNTYNVYTGAFTMSGSGTVMAYAAVSGWDNSETVTATYTLVYPSLTVNPTSVMIEDGTGDARTSEIVTVTSENVSGSYSTNASNNWTASMLRSNASMTLTYNGKALHQYGSGSISQGGLTAGVAGEYLYTGPIYILGNTSSWTANDGILMTRDANTGLYTATFTAQNSGDGYAYVGFTKRLGSNANDWSSIEAYRFGPVSNDQNWALYNQWADNRDVYCPLDTAGGYSTIQVPMGTWLVTIDSYNNQFKIREAVTSGYVESSDQDIDFGTRNIGTTTTQTVRIYNTGDVAFTPELSLSGLDGTPFTVSGNGEVAPGGYIDLTVTYTPDSEGDFSGSFTVVINNESTTVNLTGSAVTGGGQGGDDSGTMTTIRSRHSNIVTVTVYKTDMEVYAPYTQGLVDTADVMPTLPAGVTNAMSVQVNSKRPIAINGYNVYHNTGSAACTVDDANWAVDGHMVSFSVHDKISNAYLPYDLQGNTFIQRPITKFPETGSVVNNMWVDHIDYVTVTDEDTYYVPVVTANGKVTPNNTYGSPIEASPLGSVELSVGYSVGRQTEVDGENYIWMTAGGTIVGYAPELVEDGHHYEGYRYRVWRIIIMDGTPIDTVPMFDLVTTDRIASFGSNQFPLGNNGQYISDENSFLVPVGATVQYLGRFYYVRKPDQALSLRAVEETDGLIESSSPYNYYVVETTGSDIYTDVTDIIALKEVVEVTYVNPLGMMSDRPFDGVNIVITRYNDGTISTVKVIK